MQFFKSTLFVALAFAATYVAAAPAASECIPLISKLACTQDSDCCSNECYLPDSVIMIIFKLHFLLTAGNSSVFKSHNR